MGNTRIQRTLVVGVYQYVGFNQDLLFGESDDDNTTEWYVINANWGATKLGYSYCSEGDKLIHLKETPSR